MTQYNRPGSLPAWAESGDKVQPTNPEIQTGWPVTNTPPSRQRFNWVLNYVANAVRYLMQRGIPEWAADEDYPLGARVLRSGLVYRSLNGTGNINQDPSTANSTFWERWGFANSEVQPKVDSILFKSVAGGSTVTLTAAEADNGILVFTGALTANIAVVLPNVNRRYAVFNSTTGSFTLTLRTPTPSATTQITQNTATNVFTDGAQNVRQVGGLGSVSTAPQFDNSTALATTAFVQRALGNFSGGTTTNASATLTAANVGQTYTFTGSAPGQTLTLPAASAIVNGGVITLINQASVGVTVSRAGSDTLNLNATTGAVSATTFLLAPGDTLVLSSNGTNAWNQVGFSTPSESFIQPINATVSANALTLTLAQTKLDFRSPTLTSGAVNTRTVAAPISLTVPQGATLGTLNGIAARFVLLAIDNAGTIELAVVNIAGGNALDETGVISTTAISAAATAANVVYSTTARTNVPYRVVGFIDNTQTTAGTYVAAPSLVQGAGGLVFSALSGASLSANGFQRLPSGLIVQWVTGATSTAGEVSETVTLPIAFPNQNLFAVASTLNTAANNGADTNYQVVSRALTSVTVFRNQNPTNANAAAPLVIAIGF